VDYLTSTLVARQHAIARYWFDRVDPLDHFAIATQARGAELCFDDLALAYRLGADPAATQYRVASYDKAASPIGAGATFRATGTAGHTCVGPLTLAPVTSGGDGYTIIRVETARPDATGATLVHVAADPKTRAPRVIGIWRL
jgi:hypothetical protein